jgi:hypothetical protein
MEQDGNKWAFFARMSVRVIRAVLTTGRSLPVYPDNRTFSGFGGMSQRCRQKLHPDFNFGIDRSERHTNAILNPDV